MGKGFCPVLILTRPTVGSLICKLILTKINWHMRISVWKSVLECYLKDWLSASREYRWQRKLSLVWLVSRLGAYKVWLKSIFKCSYQLHWPAPFPGWSTGLFCKLNGHFHSIFYYVLLPLLVVFPFVRKYLTNWWNIVYTPWILFQRRETREAVATASLKVFSRHIECPKKLEFLCFSLLLQKIVNLCYGVLWKEPKCLRE